jgi:hypothetical protein
MAVTITSQVLATRFGSMQGRKKKRKEKKEAHGQASRLGCGDMQHMKLCLRIPRVYSVRLEILFCDSLFGGYVSYRSLAGPCLPL